MSNIQYISFTPDLAPSIYMIASVSESNLMHRERQKLSHHNIPQTLQLCLFFAFLKSPCISFAANVRRLARIVVHKRGPVQ